MNKHLVGLLAFLACMATSVAYAAVQGEQVSINALPLSVVIGFMGKYAVDAARALMKLLPAKWGLALKGKAVVVLAFVVCVLGAYVWCRLPGVTAEFGFWPAVEASLAALGLHQVLKT